MGGPCAHAQAQVCAPQTSFSVALELIGELGQLVQLVQDLRRDLLLARRELIGLGGEARALLADARDGLLRCLWVFHHVLLAIRRRQHDDRNQ